VTLSKTYHANNVMQDLVEACSYCDHKSCLNCDVSVVPLLNWKKIESHFETWSSDAQRINLTFVAHSLVANFVKYISAKYYLNWFSFPTLIIEVLGVNFFFETQCTLIPLCQPSGGVVTRSHSLKVQKRDCKISARADVLGFRIVNFRNDLPEYLVTVDSVNVFKNRFDKHCSHMRFSTDVHDWWRNTANNKIGLQAYSLWKTEDDDDDDVTRGHDLRLNKCRA